MEDDVRERGRSEAGMAAFLAILITALGFFLVAVVVTLFATGLAQNQIFPLIQARVDSVKASLPLARGDAAVEEVVRPEPGRSPVDSLQALVTQIETEKAFLARHAEELDLRRARIESVVSELQSVQNDEVLRQAKLYAAMKPEEAARILYALDDATLVAVLKSMNARAASKIMGRLDPRRLARLSMEGIGRPQLAEMDLSAAGAQ